MSEVTRILSAIEQGDPSAAEQLLPLVYDELRKLAALKMAQEKPGQTLDATALVHEAYLRLVANPSPCPPPRSGEGERGRGFWNSRGHFFAAAAEAMRRILIESARSKCRGKRGGGWRRVNLEDLEVATSVTPDQLLLLDETIERLVERDAVAGKLVRMRYYAGLSLDQAAVALGISTASAYRHWAYARAWLHCELLHDSV